ncbi:MFS transporter [Fodinicola acaciae]|uniref:MFS transporter n=1 Tax=Fodinicola acaciae TaxID=2681555 RepID=UPI0013D228A4|nr:MFS transporter [Fodinicola acaciae]
MTGRVRWVLMGSLLLPLTFVMSLDRTNMTVSAPVIQEKFGFSLAEMSVILTSFFWTYALFQVPGGLLAQKIGPRKTLTGASVWWSLFTLLTPFGGNFLGFTAIRALLGVGQAADWPTSVLALRRWFPTSERSRGNSLLLAGLYLGPIVGTPLTVWLISQFGWEWSFYLYAVVGFVIAGAWWLLMRDRPRDHPLVGEREAAHIENGQPAETEVRTNWRTFVSSGQFWAVGLQYGFLILIQGFFVTWLPTYLVQDRGFSLKEMGFGASLPWVAMLVMVFVTAAVTDRILRHTGSVLKARVPLAIGGFLVSAVFLILAALTPNPWTMIALLMVSLGGVGVVQVQVWSACQDLSGKYAATVSGWANFWGNLTSALGPLFTAAMVALGANWTLALIVLGSSGVLGAVCWIFVRPDRPLSVGGQASSTEAASLV